MPLFILEISDLLFGFSRMTGPEKEKNLYHSWKAMIMP
jgi:hypothetical protein